MFVGDTKTYVGRSMLGDKVTCLACDESAVIMTQGAGYANGSATHIVCKSCGYEWVTLTGRGVVRVFVPWDKKRKPHKPGSLTSGDYYVIPEGCLPVLSWEEVK